MPTVAEPKEKLPTVVEPKAKLPTVAEPKEKLSTVAEPKEKLPTVAEPKAKLSTVAKPKAMPLPVAKPKEDEAKKPAKKTSAKKALPTVVKPKAAPTSKARTAKKAVPSKKTGKKGTGRDIGIDVNPPEGTCTDKDCPFHGTLPVRGQILEGQVVSDKMQKTAVVKRDYMRKSQKYERFEKRSNKYVVHNPPCLGIKAGDNVKIMECRPLSKLVSFVIIEKMQE